MIGHVLWVLRHSPVEHGDRLVLISLAVHATESDETYPGVATVAQEARLGESTVRAALARLVDAGALEPLDGESRYRTRRYRLILDPSENQSAQNERSDRQILDPPENQTAQNEQSDRQNLAVRPLDSGPNTTYVYKQEKEKETTVAGGAGGEALFEMPDPVGEIHSFYRNTVPGKANSRLSKEQRKLIGRALEERRPETVKQAIVGLAQSEHHIDGGWTALRYAIGKVKTSETVGDRIDMMAAKAKQSPQNAGKTFDAMYAKFPSEVRDMVKSWVEDVRAMLRNPQNRGLKTTGEARLQRLRERGIELEIDGTRVVGWREANS